MITHWWIGRDYAKWAEQVKAFAQLLVSSISMLILALLISMGAMIGLVLYSKVFQQYFVSSCYFSAIYSYFQYEYRK